jgi:hypothetical protein
MNNYRMVVSCDDDAELCKRCGTRSDWHSEFDGQCPDDDSPRIDSAAFDPAANPAHDFNPLAEMSDEQLSNLSSEIHAELLRRFLDKKEV